MRLPASVNEPALLWEVVTKYLLFVLRKDAEEEEERQDNEEPPADDSIKVSTSKIKVGFCFVIARGQF